MIKKTLTVLIFICMALGLVAQEVKIDGNQFKVSGNDIWFNGINSPWHLFVDFGRDETEAIADQFSREWWTEEFAKYKENKINLARVWIFCNGEVSPEIDEDGFVSGVNEYFYGHLDHLFKVSRENEVYILPCLLSFDITKGYHPKHPRWRKWLSSEENVQSFIDSVVVDMVKRYENEPFLLGWEICNEPEWIFENSSEHGDMTFDDVQKMHAMIAAAIHEISDKPVTTGSSAPKWNSPAYKESGNVTTGNMWSDSALSSCINDSQAYLDFYQYHWYPWQSNSGLGSPFTHTTVHYQVDDKPLLVGESSGHDVNDGSFNQTVVEMYENAFENGFDGVCAWKTPQNDGHGTFEEIAVATNEFHKNHADLVYPSWDPILVTSIQVEPSEYTFEVNDEYKMLVSFEPAKASNRDVIWSLENDNISVDEDGNIKGLKEGTCRLTATSVDGNYQSYCDVTITEDLPPKQFVLMVEKTGDGIISLDPEPNPTTLTYEEGTVVTITAEDVVGYRFSEWTGNKESTSSVIEIKMTSNKSVKAIFEVYTGICDSPSQVTDNSFEINGAGEFCYVVDGQIGIVNSWNINVLEINGVDYSGYSASMPDAINGKYYIKYESSSPSGHFEAKNVILNTSTPTGMSLGESLVESIYPNPFTDQFNIVLAHPEQVNSIVIFDSKGTMVSFLTSGFSNTMSLGSELHAGLYMVLINSNNYQETIRITKE